jgi:hypothetical protein
MEKALEKETTLDNENQGTSNLVDSDGTYQEAQFDSLSEGSTIRAGARL